MQEKDTTMRATIKPGTVVTQMDRNGRGRVWIWPKMLGGEPTSTMVFEVKLKDANYELTRESEFTGEDAIHVWQGSLRLGSLRFLPEEPPASTEASE